MRKLFILLTVACISNAVSAQKIDSIFFNLYTDSLKKGFYNYINVDGKLSDGSWMPLDSTHIILSSNAGDFQGNDLFIDSSWMEDKIKVKAILRSNPRIQKQVTIYIRKRGFDEPLKTDEEILGEMRRTPSGKKKKGI
jgi:hypothetical protein